VTRVSKSEQCRAARRAHEERIIAMYRAKIDAASRAGDVVQVVALALRCADHLRPQIPVGGGLITGTEADDLAEVVDA
jgi:heptaprenylglyceryl phosphate synthase